MRAKPDALALHRNLEIDRLRAFAALMVVFVHYANFFFPDGPILQTSIWHLFTASWSGVDLFFVISGFIISKVLVEKLDHSAAPWCVIKNFFLHRFYRLFPPVCAMFLIVLLLSATLHQPSFFSTPSALLKGGGAILTFWFNFYFAAHEATLRIIGPYWSLALEVQFYLCFPFFLLLVSCPRRRILSLTILLLIITFFIRPWVSDPFYNTLTRCDGILYGCLLYYLMQSSRLRSLLLRLQTFYLGKVLAGVLLVAIVLYPAMIASLRYCIPVICMTATLLVALASLEAKFVSFGKANGVLNYLGARSYSLYVVHFPLFMVVRVLVPPSVGEMTLAATIFILSGTELCYRCIERPVLTWFRGQQGRVAR